jgi:hypothetical protein
MAWKQLHEEGHFSKIFIAKMQKWRLPQKEAPPPGYFHAAI